MNVPNWKWKKEQKKENCTGKRPRETEDSRGLHVTNASYIKHL